MGIRGKLIKYGFTGKKHSFDSKEKMRLAKLKNPTRYWLGKKRDKDTIEKIKNSKIGKPAWNKGIKRIGWINSTSFKKGHKMTKSVRKKISESESGENHYNWQRGKSFEPYSIEFNKALKYKIRNKYNFICQECKKHGNIVHHIDYDKKNCDELNLIVLCRKCHSKTNFGRNEWKRYFQNIIAAAETKRSNTKTDR